MIIVFDQNSYRNFNTKKSNYMNFLLFRRILKFITFTAKCPFLGTILGNRNQSRVNYPILLRSVLIIFPKPYLIL